MLLLGVTDTTAQESRRRSINSYEPEERVELNSLIQGYLDFDFLMYHSGGRIHENSRFGPWHRYAIGYLEKRLLLDGYVDYVPLPSWDPRSPFPEPFANPESIFVEEDPTVDPTGIFNSNYADMQTDHFASDQATIDFYNAIWGPYDGVAVPNCELPLWNWDGMFNERS